jgi:hypothetical protein
MTIAQKVMATAQHCAGNRKGIDWLIDFTRPFYFTEQ